MTREANSKAEQSITADQQKKLQDKVEKCKQDVQKVRAAALEGRGRGARHTPSSLRVHGDSCWQSSLRETCLAARALWIHSSSLQGSQDTLHWHLEPGETGEPAWNPTLCLLQEEALPGYQRLLAFFVLERGALAIQLLLPSPLPQRISAPEPTPNNRCSWWGCGCSGSNS